MRQGIPQPGAGKDDTVLDGETGGEVLDGKTGEEGKETKVKNGGDQEKEPDKIDRQSFEVLVRSVDLQKTPDAMMRLKADLDASGWDYKKERDFREQLDVRIGEVSKEAGGLGKIREIFDVWGMDTLSPTRRKEFSDRGHTAIQQALKDPSRVDKGWLKEGIDVLQIAGMSHGEIADLVKARLDVQNASIGVIQELFEMVPGLLSRYEKKS